MHLKRIMPTVALLATLAASGPINAAVIKSVSDNFSDGNVTAGDIAWYGSIASANPTTDNTNAMGAANAQTLKLQLNGNNQSLHGYFDGYSLTQAGDYVNLAFDYQYDSASIVNGVRIGLVDSAGSQFDTTANNAGDLNGDKGYAFSFNPGASDTTNHEVAAYAGVTTAGVFNATFTRLGTTYAVADPGDTAHAVNLRIERLTGGDLSISASMAGVLSAVRTAPAAGAVYSFDQVYLRLGGSGNRGPVYLDNVVVSTNVPEPATLSVVVAGVVLLMRRKRSA